MKPSDNMNEKHIPINANEKHKPNSTKENMNLPMHKSKTKTQLKQRTWIQEKMDPTKT